MKINVPKLSLIVLVGPSGSGKSTFAQKHFHPFEVISSDYCRGLVSNNENDQSVTKEAFEILHFVTAKRLTHGLLTVVDATNVQPEARKPLVELARRFHCMPVAIVLNTPFEVCAERNQHRPDRQFGSHVVRQQVGQLRRSLRFLKREGFRYVHVLDSMAPLDSVTIDRTPLWSDRRDDRGPFDIIGDIHGCCDELEVLLSKLGYTRQKANASESFWGDEVFVHPAGRKAVFVGDLVDRGPRVLDVLRIVRNMVEHRSGLCVPGNHDVKLLKHLKGAKVQVTHGLENTLSELESLPDTDRDHHLKSISTFLDGLVSHYVLDDGKLVVAHAGMKEEMQGRASAAVRNFALYGETTGELDVHGLPERINWAADYRGTASVVYGHTPVRTPDWLNNTINIDTGCVFGGKLTALRYPERELVCVAANKTYCVSIRDSLFDEHATSLLSSQHQNDDVLDAACVLGKRIISTRIGPTTIVREENSTAALEVMSRFAANPKWLIYLPPTMSPCETSQKDGLLEHPSDAFAYYQSQDVEQVVCQEKHMGSRAIVVVCRDSETAHKRFGILENEDGIVYTRTGRRFFNDPVTEQQLIERIRLAMTASGFWETFDTNWACMDCELMPWSAKAQELLRKQYAAVGAAGSVSLKQTVSLLEQTSARWEGDRTDLNRLRDRFRRRLDATERYVNAYRQYCWPVHSLDDLKLAPFHLLATEGKVHTNQDHLWHMSALKTICQADPSLLLATNYRLVNLNDALSTDACIDWWSELTERGGEGMVVKPLDWLPRGPRGLAQPAVKCRGKEYLRIIYGPDYDSPENLPRLKKRGLGRKRSLAVSEFTLGLEALERFVAREPLRRIHECVFGILALESEPVDPRL